MTLRPLIVPVAFMVLLACGAPAGPDSGTPDAGQPDSGSGGGGGGSGGGSTGGGVGGSGGSGGGSGLLPPGATCLGDSSCASGLCRSVQTLTPTPATVRECVLPCSTQSACGDGGTFCLAYDAGVAPGVCVPSYPLHCATCAADSDCGELSESCVLAPGEPAAACHVDCSLAGAAACPAGFSCSTVTTDAGARQLCRPVASTCLDANGGACSPGSAPLSCARESDAGSCAGSRVCDGGQYTACDAAPANCLATCTTAPPSGCTLARCPNAAVTPLDCGTCGVSCPGVGQATANVTCTAPACSFSCKGEAYDVDADAGNGCEIADTPTGNHARTSATALGSYSCSDGSSAQNFSGHLPSDQQVHESPPVASFDSVTGSAPDWYSINATGGLTCVNDLALTLTVTGSLPTCYRLTAITNNGTWSCTTALGTCSISQGSGTYSGGTTISISVEKTCSSAQHENAAYTVTGHL